MTTDQVRGNHSDLKDFSRYLTLEKYMLWDGQSSKNTVQGTDQKQNCFCTSDTKKTKKNFDDVIKAISQVHEDTEVDVSKAIEHLEVSKGEPCVVDPDSFGRIWIRFIKLILIRNRVAKNQPESRLIFLRIHFFV